MKISYPAGVVKISNIFRRYGHSAYAVGGCVRDSVMGRTPYDWDMTTDASPERMLEIFSSEGIKTIPTGLKHGTVTALLDGESFEITTFRIDGGYTDSRHPDSVIFTRNLSDDLVRRDFTINAMAADPSYKENGTENEITDLFGGIDDINNKVIRAVGDPERRFCEDALRILRGVRFASTLGFTIEEETKFAAKKLGQKLEMVSVERKKTELEKILLSDNADMGISLLFELDLAKYIHNELKMPEIPLCSLPKCFETRISAMFGYEKVPSLASMKLSNAESSRIKLLCNSSLYSDELSGENARRLISIFGDIAEDAALLHKNNALSELISLEREKNPCVRISDLKISGGELKDAGIEPRKIGRIMEILLSEVIKCPENNNRDTLLNIALDTEKII